MFCTDVARKHLAEVDPNTDVDMRAPFSAPLFDIGIGINFGVMGLPVRHVVELMGLAGIPYNFSR